MLLICVLIFYQPMILKYVVEEKAYESSLQAEDCS